MEELDQAKKDLSEIRAKSGLPDDDAKPDLERLMEEERAKISSTSKDAERLLIRARRDSAQGNYEQAIQQIDEALSILPANTSTIALVSDLFQAKQQVVWYQMGEAMLKGKVRMFKNWFLITKRLRSPAEMQKQKPSEREMKLTLMRKC